jgi:hypothetical protein
MMKPVDIMRQCEGLLAVWLGVPPEHEEEFNAWYKYEHMAELIGLEGFISARRYRADWLQPPYLALYETVDAAAQTSPAFEKMLANPTPWSARMRGYYGDNRIRNNYARIALAARDGHPYGTLLLMVQSNAAPGKHQAVEDWFKANAPQRASGARSPARANIWSTMSSSPRKPCAHVNGPGISPSGAAMSPSTSPIPSGRGTPRWGCSSRAEGGSGWRPLPDDDDD